MLGNTRRIQHLQKVDQVEANTHTAGTHRRRRVCEHRDWSGACVSLLTNEEDSGGQQQVRGQREPVGDAQEENCQQGAVTVTRVDTWCVCVCVKPRVQVCYLFRPLRPTPA